MSMESEKQLFKTIFTIKGVDGIYSAFIQVAGFESEEEARKYLIKEVNANNFDIINPDDIKTIH